MNLLFDFIWMCVLCVGVVIAVRYFSISKEQLLWVLITPCGTFALVWVHVYSKRAPHMHTGKALEKILKIDFNKEYVEDYTGSSLTEPQSNKSFKLECITTKNFLPLNSKRAFIKLYSLPLSFTLKIKLYNLQ